MTESQYTSSARGDKYVRPLQPCGCSLSLKKDDFYPRNWSRTFLVRVITALSLIVATTVCSTLAYFVLVYQEQVLYDSQYYALTDQAIDIAVEDMETKIRGARVMAEIVGQIHPDIAAWPNVTIPGFAELTKRITELSSTRGVLLAPFVDPSERAGFVDFAMNYYDNEPSIPDDIGIGANGVYKFDSTGARVPDLTGATSYGSENSFLTPTLQVAWAEGEPVNHAINLFNLHAEPRRGASIDSMYACAQDNVDGSMSDRRDCSSFTDFLDLLVSGEDVSTVIFQPVYPANNATQISGFILMGTMWKSLLANILPDFISGIDVVLESSTGQAYTFRLDDGKAELRGEGDLHDRSYSSYKNSDHLVQTFGLAPQSVSYSITFYPRAEFFEYYETDLPVNATIAVVLIMLITACIFIVHDYFLKRESNERQEVLKTKRKFVRFISHEIRTPLNTVALGLKLLESELKDALDWLKTSTTLATEDSKESEGSANDTTNAASSSATSRGVVDIEDMQKRVGALGSMLEKFTGWLELTDDISANNQSAISVLNDLLNYDKIEMGTMALDYGITNLWQLCERVAKTFEIQAKQVGVAIEIDLEINRESTSAQQRSELQRLLACGDEMRLTQVLRNIISNALKFTPRGGELHITAAWNQNGLMSGKNPHLVPAAAAAAGTPGLQGTAVRAGSLVLSFKDSGAGLSAEQLARMFTEGVQFNAKELQAGQGSGLGLAISKGLIELHGGTMIVTSEGLGKGCTFIVELPVLRAEQSDIESAAGTTVLSDRLPAAAEGNFGTAEDCLDPADVLIPEFEELIIPKFENLNLLVVDDSQMNRKMLTRLLARAGHRCVEAEDGIHALEQYNAATTAALISAADDDDGRARGASSTAGNSAALEPFDCILMDFEMPRLNGPDATKQLRDLGCSVVIVGVTGNVLPEDRRYFLDMGANSVLAKPLNMSELSDVWQQQKKEKMLLQRKRTLSLSMSISASIDKPTALRADPSSRDVVKAATSSTPPKDPPSDDSKTTL